MIEKLEFQMDGICNRFSATHAEGVWNCLLNVWCFIYFIAVVIYFIIFRPCSILLQYQMWFTFEMT